MDISALMAPMYTTSRGCRIAMIAAIMNVSSPSSVTRICIKAARAEYHAVLLEGDAEVGSEGTEQNPHHEQTFEKGL